MLVFLFFSLIHSFTYVYSLCVRLCTSLLTCEPAATGFIIGQSCQSQSHFLSIIRTGKPLTPFRFSKWGRKIVIQIGLAGVAISGALL